MGRNSGSTMASAASGKSAPLVSTADRNGGPSPGRGARSVSCTRTATSTGSALRTAIVTQVRGRRNSLRSSTPITGPPPPGRQIGEHTSELQSRQYLVCRLLLEKKKHHYLFFTLFFINLLTTPPLHLYI